MEKCRHSRAAGKVGKNAGSFSAAEQGLGYIYQGRFALLKILEARESTAVLVEKNDDVELVDVGGSRSLSSLKHKAPGDTLTDLSTDFWKSVRIWLGYYSATGRIGSDGQFFLFSTAAISPGSFLQLFANQTGKAAERAKAAGDALKTTKSDLIIAISEELARLDDAEREDFYSRISIVDNAPRITDLPAEIERHLRLVRRDARPAVFERLEGWWNDQVIRLLTKTRTDPILGFEVNDKLSAIAEEYRSDNLPITFRHRTPDGSIDAANDPRLFVEQLRFLDIPTSRIRSAIIDYYRAFEQRSSWARESLLVSGEIEEYEDRLVDEWARYRDVVFEKIDETSDIDACRRAGLDLYNWAQFQTSGLRIRERVTEPYVVRGAFHLLANERPSPRVYWHPHFFKRLAEILGVAA